MSTTQFVHLFNLIIKKKPYKSIKFQTFTIDHKRTKE